MNRKPEIDMLLKEAGRVGISGHIRPDGDCIGACMGLYLYIRNQFPDVDAAVYLEPFPDTFNFLEGADQVIHEPSKDRSFDLYFCVDCSDEKRLGAFAGQYLSAAVKVCIDHHITNSLTGDYSYIDPDASSTCELICDLIDHEKITQSAAEALYMGIVHDTGMFQYSCTSAHTMMTAGRLMEKGIDFTRIIEDTFVVKSYRQKLILGKVLLESTLVLDGQVILGFIRNREMAFFGADTSDLDGIAAILKNTKHAKVSVFASEIRPQEWKVSLRSGPQADVSLIAASMGGGGHKRASGCTMYGDIRNIFTHLTAMINDQLTESAEKPDPENTGR